MARLRGPAERAASHQYIRSLQAHARHHALAANTGAPVLTASGFKHTKKFINKIKQRQKQHQARSGVVSLVNRGNDAARWSCVPGSGSREHLRQLPRMLEQRCQRSTI